MGGLERSKFVTLWTEMGETTPSFYQCDPGQCDRYHMNHVRSLTGFR